MREIKFRAWDKRTKGFIQFDLKFIPSHFIQYDERFIVTQYTGLKDKNGKEIYEGDIIEIQSQFKERFYKGEVKYLDYKFGCEGFMFTHYDNPYDIFSEELNRIEVIGNIYENSELLKGDLK